MDNNYLHNAGDLFKRIADGDHEAFRLLLTRHQGHIFGQALAYLKDVQKAEDVVQEVFFIVWNNRNKLKDMHNPEGYLLIIARNKIINEFRKKVPVDILDKIEQIYKDPAMPINEFIEVKQMWESIQSAVNKLSPQRKKVFEMSKRDGLKYQEIADSLGISRETVKVHIVKALAFIRSFISNQVPVILFYFLLG